MNNKVSVSKWKEKINLKSGFKHKEYEELHRSYKLTHERSDKLCCRSTAKSIGMDGWI